MSKSMLVQNNHFSKVCTIFCFEKYNNFCSINIVIKIFLNTETIFFIYFESIEGDPIIIDYIVTVVTTNDVIV